MIAAKYLEHRTVDCDAVGYLDRAEALPPGPNGAARIRLTGWCFCSGCGAPHALRFRLFSQQDATTTLAPVRRDDVVACYDGRTELAYCGFDQEVSLPAATAAALADGALGAVELADGAPSHADEEVFWARVFEPQVHFAAHHMPPPPPPPLVDEPAPEPELEEEHQPEYDEYEPEPEEEEEKEEEEQPEDDESEEQFAPWVATRAAPTVMAVDGVYVDPLNVRAFALSQEFRPHPEYHRGERTDAVFLFPGLRELVQRRLGVRVSPARWAAHPSNGCFQWCRAGDPVVFHTDFQRWAGVLFLTPDAPVQCGTSLYRPRGGHWDHADATRVETVDAIGNVFNRLVLFNAHAIHSASQYFGSDRNSGRLFQMFFFDTDEEDDDAASFEEDR